MKVLIDVDLEVLILILLLLFSLGLLCGKFLCRSVIEINLIGWMASISFSLNNLIIALLEEDADDNKEEVLLGVMVSILLPSPHKTNDLLPPVGVPWWIFISTKEGLMYLICLLDVWSDKFLALKKNHIKYFLLAMDSLE